MGTRATRSAAWGALALALLTPRGPAAEPLVFRHENVLGTSLELRVRTANVETAREVESRVLREMDRWSGVFSTYQPGTELSRWLGTRDVAVSVSPELFEVFRRSEQWHEATGGAFNPAVEGLSRIWKAAVARGSRPTPAELAPGLAWAASPAWRLEEGARTAMHLHGAPVTFNALAKGWIVERAGTAALYGLAGVDSMVLNVGGDLRHWGTVAERVEIADPRSDAENAPHLAAVLLQNQAMATSGGYRRYFELEGRRYSHLIDPRTGQPAEAFRAATVVAASSVTADVLATVLNLVPMSDIRMPAGEAAGVEWLTVSPEGRVARSDGWGRLAVGEVSSTPWASLPAAVVAPAPAGAVRPVAGEWPNEFELRIDFELNQAEGGRYLRPYVAAWIEDADGFPVRTLALWLLQGEKGRRWLPDLRRWSRSDQMRGLVDPQDLVGTVSSATRPPGKYGLVWDGKDDHGKPVKAGKYTFYLEAAREHGTYQLMKHAWTAGQTPVNADLPGNVEIKRCTLGYRKRMAK